MKSRQWNKTNDSSQQKITTLNYPPKEIKNPTNALILLFNHSARQEKTNNSILINQMAKINLIHQS